MTDRGTDTVRAKDDTPVYIPDRDIAGNQAGARGEHVARQVHQRQRCFDTRKQEPRASYVEHRESTGKHEVERVATELRQAANVIPRACMTSENVLRQLAHTVNYPVQASWVTWFVV